MQIVIAGTEDGIAETVLGRDAWAAFESRPPIREGRCPCGFFGDLLGGRCLRCAETHDWATTNRLFCELLHRTRV